MTDYVNCTADAIASAHDVYRITFAMTGATQALFPTSAQAFDFSKGMDAIYDHLQTGDIRGVLPLSDNPSGDGRAAGTVDCLITPNGDGRRLGDIVDALNNSDTVYGVISHVVGVARIQKISIHDAQGNTGSTGRAGATAVVLRDQPNILKTVTITTKATANVLLLVAAVVAVVWVGAKYRTKS